MALNPRAITSPSPVALGRHLALRCGGGGGGCAEDAISALVPDPDDAEDEDADEEEEDEEEEDADDGGVSSTERSQYELTFWPSSHTSR